MRSQTFKIKNIILLLILFSILPNVISYSVHANWTFNNTLNDATGNYNLTAYNKEVYINDSIYNDGSDGFYEINSASSIINGDQDWTFNLWFKPNLTYWNSNYYDTSHYGNFFHNTGATDGFLIGTFNYDIRVFNANGFTSLFCGLSTYEDMINDSEWNTLTVQYNATDYSIDMFINGIECPNGKTSFSAGISPSTGNAGILYRYSGNNRFLEGQYKKYVIYDGIATPINNSEGNESTPPINNTIIDSYPYITLLNPLGQEYNYNDTNITLSAKVWVESHNETDCIFHVCNKTQWINTNCDIEIWNDTQLNISTYNTTIYSYYIRQPEHAWHTWYITCNNTDNSSISNNANFSSSDLYINSTITDLNISATCSQNNGIKITTKFKCNGYNENCTSHINYTKYDEYPDCKEYGKNPQFYNIIGQIIPQYNYFYKTYDCPEGNYTFIVDINNPDYINEYINVTCPLFNETKFSDYSGLKILSLIFLIILLIMGEYTQNLVIRLVAGIFVFVFAITNLITLHYWIIGALLSLLGIYLMYRAITKAWLEILKGKNEY